MLEGKIALITGSTGVGMGRSTAFTLARNGADIVLNYGTYRKDADAEKNAELAQNAISDMGRRSIIVKADTRVAGDVSNMVKTSVEEFGRIDILVNNAGGDWAPMDITEIPPEQFRNVIEAEIDGAFLCTRECLPFMRKNRWGRIINVGMYGAGHWAAENFGPVEYAIGKGGRALLTKHLATKERKHNITVNMINPPDTKHFASIDTALSYSTHSEEWKNRGKVTPQDIADTILFLCTDEARFITGSHITFAAE